MKNEIITSNLANNSENIFKYELLSNYTVIKNDDEFNPTYQQVLSFIDKLGYITIYDSKSTNMKELLRIEIKNLLKTKIKSPLIKIFCKADNNLYYLDGDTNTILFNENILEEKGKILIDKILKNNNEKKIVENIMKLKKLDKNKTNNNNLNNIENNNSHININNKNNINNNNKIKIKNKKETEEEKLLKKIHDLEIENELLKKANFNLKKQMLNKSKNNKN